MNNEWHGVFWIVLRMKISRLVKNIKTLENWAIKNSIDSKAIGFATKNSIDSKNNQHHNQEFY